MTSLTQEERKFKRKTAKKQRLIIVVILLAVLPLISAAACPATNEVDISDMPCEEITPIIQNQTECNVTITDINNSNNNYTIEMTQRGDDSWNYSFNVNYSNSSVTSYYQTLCDNSTSTVTINFEETANEYWYIFLLFFLVFAVIFIIGEWKQNFIFKYIAGALLLIIGLYIFINGIPGQALSFLDSGDSSAWVSWTSFILIFLGLAYSLKTVYQNVWGGEEEW